MFSRKIKAAAAATAFSCMLTMMGQESVLADSVSMGNALEVSAKHSDMDRSSYLGFGRLYPFASASVGNTVYSFTTTQKKSYYQVKALTGEESVCHVEIFDEAGNSLVAQADLGNAEYQCFALQPSATYLLKVFGKDSASGEIIMSEITDDHQDTAADASVANLNKEYSVTSECQEDIDYLKFATDDKDTSYTLNIDPASGTTGGYEVLDEEGNLLEGCSGATGQDEKISKKLPVEHGKTYYVKIFSSETGRRVLVSVKQAVNKYKIVYHLDGGTNHKDNKTSYTSSQNLTLKNPTKKGYLFDGWYRASNFSQKISSVKGSAKSDYDLYAKWKKVTAGTVSVQSFSSTSPGKAKLVFGAVSGVKGYQVSLSRDGQKPKNKDITGTSISYSGLVQGEKYSVQVRSYAIDSCGNRVYGAYSKSKSVTVKKKVVKKKKAAKKKAEKKK